MLQNFDFLLCTNSDALYTEMRSIASFFFFFFFFGGGGGGGGGEGRGGNFFDLAKNPNLKKICSFFCVCVCGGGGGGAGGGTEFFFFDKESNIVC